MAGLYLSGVRTRVRARGVEVCARRKARSGGWGKGLEIFCSCAGICGGWGRGCAHGGSRWARRLGERVSGGRTPGSTDLAEPKADARGGCATAGVGQGVGRHPTAYALTKSPPAMDTVDRATRSRIMASVRPYDSRPEVRVRGMLRDLRLEFRRHVASLPGKPDFVVASHRTVIFVNGCFWHRHTCSKGRSHPTSNRAAWAHKFAANRMRDQRTRRQLNRLGWRVVTVWECRLKDEDRLRRRLTRHFQPQLSQ